MEKNRKTGPWARENQIIFEITQDGGLAEEQLDRIPRQLFVRRFDLFCFCFAMITYCFDIISDIVTALFHYYDDRAVACLFILLLSIVPSIVLNAVSFAWICDDNQNKAKIAKAQGNQAIAENGRESYLYHALMCILQVGPLWWYYKALIHGIHFRMESDPGKRRKHFCRMIEAERDATLLRFFEGFLESAPQLIIQGNILSEYLWWHFNETNSIFALPRWVYVQLISMMLSLLSVCWSISIQHRSLRMVRPDKVNMHPHESVMQYYRCPPTNLELYHRFFCIFSFQWCISKLYRYSCENLCIDFDFVLKRKALNISSRGLEEGLTFINAAIHIFTPFNMADGPTRWRYATAYAIEATEASVRFSYYFHESFKGVEPYFVVIFFSIWMKDNSIQFPYKVQAAVLCGILFVTGALLGKLNVKR
ncbi:unnamed protein product [Strongylus vulgaris]|uniref:XK-related protein n=1 Tax=Strongylus vulgaris TaxID=40348 RepID=A0A3P7J4D1_STRVU|nr:unnamed protein product [Strongylus vulgaris]